MERQARRVAAGRRHDVDVGIAADGGGERDARSVRRKPRIDLRARRRRQPARLSAAARHRPEIAAVLEGDQLAANRRAPQ